MKPERLSDEGLLPILNEDPRSWEARVGIALLRFHSRLERRFAHRLGEFGLSLPQFDVLMTLATGEGISQQELAERLLVTKGNVVGIIDRTSASGWVERRPDPEDRRANRLYLTEAGRQLIARSEPGQTGLIRQIFGVLTAGELHLMHELLGKLERATQESACPPTRPESDSSTDPGSGLNR